MKRGRINNLFRFRKAARLRPLAAAIAGASLAGCGQDTEQVHFVSSPEECAANTALSLAQCQSAYQKALAEAQQTAPRYGRLEDCVADFGLDACREYQTPSAGHYFMPFMAGWVVSEIIDEVGDAYERRAYRPVFQYRKRDGSRALVTATGARLTYGGYGAYRAPSKAITKQAPKVTRTISRGGFGSKAAAKSHWGGGTRSSSWGG